jgi:hypothetical protein
VLLPLALTLALAQTPPSAEASADKAAAAAQKAAEAAEKASEAIQRIADSVAPRPAPAAAAAAPAPQTWTGAVGLGLTFITGNALTLTATGSVALDRKWTDWALGIRLSGAYGVANPTANVETSTASVTALRASGTVRGDRSFGSGFASLFILAGSEFDHVKNLESRSIGEAGASLTFFNVKEADYEKLFLKLDLALRGGYETRYQYFPAARIDPYGLIILAPRVAGTFRWAFSSYVRFSEELEFIPFLLAPDAGRLLINNTTKLSARITETVALTTGLGVKFDSKAPSAPGATPSVPTDVALTVGLDILL